MNVLENSDLLFTELAHQYQTPQQVQKLLHSFTYNAEESKVTQRSALAVYRAQTAHCLEGALLAAAVLEKNNFPPLIMSLESVDLLDHVVYVFKQNNRWGAVGKSRDPGLNGRAPKFRSIRDLAWSYVDPYVDTTGRVKAFEVFNLNHLKYDWRYSSKNLWALENFLVNAKHRPLKAGTRRHQKIKNLFLKNIALPDDKSWW